MVEGQPSWNASQNAWWQVPSVPSIVTALKLASKETERTSQQAVAFAKQFDIETVWQNHWMPTLAKLLK
jgi:hypothetical protein